MDKTNIEFFSDHAIFSIIIGLFDLVTHFVLYFDHVISTIKFGINCFDNGL